MSADHSITLDFTLAGILDYRMTCAAPTDALCHAVWPCECESYTDQGVDEQGRPWHVSDREGTGLAERHYGEFDQSECNYRNWFEASDVVDEEIVGSVTFTVMPESQGDYYEWHIVPSDDEVAS